jgi:cysteine desulfuration protein SufE
MENTLKFRQDEFIENMESFELWNEKFNYLIDLGNELPAMPAQMMSPQTLVHGCTSKTYFKAISTTGGLRVYAYSNSPVMCGILEAVRGIFDGVTLGSDDEIYFHTASGLIDHLTPQRKSALLQIIDRIIHTDDH